MNYRYLEKGEIIQSGDEADNCTDPWRDMPKWEPVNTDSIGKSAPDPAFVSHTKYRRLIIINNENTLGGYNV